MKGKRRVSVSLPEWQHDKLTVYAEVKGHKDISTLLLYAAQNLLSRVGYTAIQQKRADELMAELKAQREKESIEQGAGQSSALSSEE